MEEAGDVADLVDVDGGALKNRRCLFVLPSWLMNKLVSVLLHPLSVRIESPVRS